MTPMVSMPGKRNGTREPRSLVENYNDGLHVLPLNRTLAIPPVAIVMVKKVQVKCRSLSFQGILSSKIWAKLPSPSSIALEMGCSTSVNVGAITLTGGFWISWPLGVESRFLT